MDLCYCIVGSHGNGNVIQVDIIVNMKYFRIGYCPPNPGPWSKVYGYVRAYNENEIEHAIQYAKEHNALPIYVKSSYGKAYKEITFKQLQSYSK